MTGGDVSEQEGSGTVVTGYSGMPPLDVDKYREYVEDFDLTEERKVELLETLWSIMYSFVLAGFGVDSINRCLPALAENSSEEESDAVEQGSAEEFNNAAAEGKDEAS